MPSTPIISWFDQMKQRHQPHFLALSSGQRYGGRPSLCHWAAHAHALPSFVRHCPVAMRYLHLLSPLAWDNLPLRSLHANGYPHPVPYAALAAACLVKLDQQLGSMGALRCYLLDHPALVWLLGFPLTVDVHFAWGFDADASLPTQRHLTRMLRQVPNAVLQSLLDSSVALLQAEFASLGIRLGECIAMDTKVILAWVKENNPKAYLKKRERYDKTRQPSSDPDCRLGCKRRHNQRSSSKEPPPTPPDQPVPGGTISVGEFYWGYASGVVATKVPDWGEFVLAELTLPFDQPDVSYFYPLMQDTQRRLGFRPRFGAFDAAYDAWYVYAYFHRDDVEEGFAAVPYVQRGGHNKSFSPDGLPLCQAGLAMPLKSTFISRSSLVEHECGRHVCPLQYPERTAEHCPVGHPQWPKGGCITTMPTSIGARIRYQLDRDSDTYKQIYNQRTASERVFSQAVALGIERPKLRNGAAIANANTLRYVLINLRGLHRVRQRKTERRAQSNPPAVTA